VIDAAAYVAAFTFVTVMKYALQYLKTSARFIDEYNGSVPLHHYLKSRFAAEKKYGSKDRKHISHLCYCYFRLGHFIRDVTIEERIKVSLVLTGDLNWNDLLTDGQLALLNKSIRERTSSIEAQYQQSISSIFPWQEELSDDIDKDAFTLSHLHQPKLFIRLRPGAEGNAIAKLNKAGIAYEQINNTCLAFENATKLEDVLEINREYVVQDLSSQQVANLLSSVNCHSPSSVWDCCAASGGKAIMAYDMLPNINLTVSDVRQSIIHNLKSRFKQANIKTYNSFIADLSQQVSAIPYAPFDLVICDAPCSGSGTWSRTPEQLYFFKEEAITYYSNLQKKIVSNAVPFIRQGAHLLYITCSVFRKENEEVVVYIEQLGLTLVKMELLKGYDLKADTMFAALFTS
jgi:16S rRNA (cytosine967-C5)-methyltransferase